jgi:hypothetical protein
MASAAPRRPLPAPALGWLLAWPAEAAAKTPSLLVAEVSGPITPVVADHLADGNEVFVCENPTARGRASARRGE